MSDSAHNTIQACAAPGAAVRSVPHGAIGTQDALSWEMAMARAQAPAEASARGAMHALPDGVDSLAMPPRPGEGAMGGAAQPPSAAPDQQQSPVQTAHVGGDQPAQPAATDGCAGVAPQRAGTMTQEAFLEYRMRRIALGLEPLATSTRMAEAPASDLLGATTTCSQIPPLSLSAPLGARLAALPLSDRPVAEGLSVGELALERVVQAQRGEQQAQLHVADQINQQLRLDLINTPESLPLQTVKSV